MALTSTLGQYEYGPSIGGVGWKVLERGEVGWNVSRPVQPDVACWG